jgi:tellurite resistance protein TerC
MLLLWVGFVALIVALLALDLGLLHRGAKEMSWRASLGWTLAWIAVGVGFSGAVYGIYEHHWLGATLPGGGSSGEGVEAVLLYLTGYVIEKSLSVDNLFVIAVVFNTFKVENEYRYRVLFWGIVGALILRAIMIVGGIWLISQFTWLFYVFGGYLAFTGFKLLGVDDAPPDIEASPMVRFARRILPISRGHHQGKFLISEGGRLKLTMLTLVLLVIEATDVIFALDSIPAVLAISTDPFIVFTSNIFAVLGLRSLFFVLTGMMDRFRYLKKSLALILLFIGAKMIAHSWIRVPTAISLGVIVLVLILGIVLSLRADRVAMSKPEAGAGNP